MPPVTAPPGPAPAPTQTSTGQPWENYLLALLGAPSTPANIQFLNQWTIREHGNYNMYANNPFFTTAGAGGAVGPFKAGTFPSINSAGVAQYPTLGVGVYANAYHIATGYPAIRAALVSGNPAAFANNSAFQTELSTWSGGGYSGFSSIQAPSTPIGPVLNPARAGSNAGKAKSGGGGGFLGDVEGVITGAGKYIPLPGLPGGTASVSGLPNVIGGAIGQGIGNIGQVAQGNLPSIPGTAFLGKLVDPSYILRGLQIAAGAGLVLMGTFLLVRQIALANDMPDPLNAVTSKLPTGASPSQQSSEASEAIFSNPPRATRRRTPTIETDNRNRRRATRRSERASSRARSEESISDEIPF